jgi:predicted site-specific integrase-resolvase
MDLLINEQKASEILDVSKKTLQNWRVQKKGPKYYVLPHHRIRYSLEDLEKWLKNNTIEIERG